MNSPRDNDGHGTSVSSIAAGSPVDGAGYFGYASGTARGMAPRAYLAMYKTLFYQNLSTINCASDVIAAIDQAILDGVDILSMSFGLYFPSIYQDPLAIATFAAMEKGVFVSMAAGNAPFPKSVANGFPWVFTVASGTIDCEFRGRIILGNGVSISGLSFYTGEWIAKEVPLTFSKLCYTEPGPERNIVVCKDDSSSHGYRGEDGITSVGYKGNGKVHITDQVPNLYLKEIQPST